MKTVNTRVPAAFIRKLNRLAKAHKYVKPGARWKFLDEVLDLYSDPIRQAVKGLSR